MKIGEIWKHKHTGQTCSIKLIKKKIAEEDEYEIFVNWIDKAGGEFIDSGIFIEAFERVEQKEV